MSIEIKQMVVKSNVIQRSGMSEGSDRSRKEEVKKQEILDECKKLIMEAFQEMKER
jgi:hypothetical protein